MFVLLLAALSSFAGPAGAQPNQLQYVVIYAEFKPADTEAGGRVLDELASQGLASVGVIRFDASRRSTCCSTSKPLTPTLGRPRRARSASTRPPASLPTRLNSA